MRAHTPLLRSLARLALDRHAARVRGLPVEALPDLCAASRERAPFLPRRAFLSAAGAGAMAICLPRCAAPKAAPRVAVVGAGIAGLCCALELADHGVAATVYEASGRIGGRMFSNPGYFDDGQVSEWCGELIDSDNEALQRLAARFGLALDDLHGGEPEGAEETYFFDGTYYPRAQVDRDFTQIDGALGADVAASGQPGALTAAGRALDAMSVHDWIDTRVPGGHRSLLGRLIDVAYVIENGAETTDQSALDLLYYLGVQSTSSFYLFGVSDERHHVRGGNQQIPEAIARSLGDLVVRGHRLVRVARTASGRTALTFARDAGTTLVTADIAVLALPFSVLRHVDCRAAGFDARKEKMIRELGAAHNGKTQLQFEARIWNGTGPWPGTSSGSSYADTGYQNTWDVSRAQPGRSGILVFYTGGPVTDALASTAAFATVRDAGVLADARAMLARAEPVFPGLSRAWNGKATESVPHLSDLRFCSYSYRRVGQYAAFGGHEAERQGGVLFCGEHTSLDFPAHMEGAAREGARAAREVLAMLNATEDRR